MLDKPTDAMIEAGADLIGGGSTFDREDRRDMACAIYLAMKALDATIAPDPVQSDGEYIHFSQSLDGKSCIVCGARLTSLSAPVEKES